MVNPRLLSLCARRCTPVIFVVPLQLAANAAKGGKRSGQSVASNSKACKRRASRLEIVPERYVARLGAMKPQPLMEANEFERAPVTVAFTPAK